MTICATSLRLPIIALASAVEAAAAAAPPARAAAAHVLQPTSDIFTVRSSPVEGDVPTPLAMHLALTAKTVDDCSEQTISEWRRLNPGLRVTVFDDPHAKAFVAREFPHLLHVYAAFAKPVERADLFRYLVIHALGGAYSDCDARPEVPMSEWGAKFGYDLRVTGDGDNLLVAGVEFPRPNPEDPLQIVQWTFAASQPKHPILQAVIDEVARRSASVTPDDTEHVEQRTGPIAWTHAILGYVRTHNASAVGLPTRGNGTAAQMHALDLRGELIRLRDHATGTPSQLLLLPYRAFGYNQFHRHDVNPRPLWQRLLRHLFAGGWRTTREDSFRGPHAPGESELDRVRGRTAAAVPA